MLGARLTLDDHLTATATGTAGLSEQLAIGASCGNGQRGNSHIRILGTSSKESRALGTEARGVGGILLIAANNLDTIIQSYGSTHMKVGVGGVTALGSLDGSRHEMLFGR